MVAGRLCLFAVSLSGSAAGDVLEPHTIHFEDLMRERRFGRPAQEGFQKALTSHGLLQVSDIPGFAALRQRALREAHHCIAEAPHAQTLTFPDGTLRRTLAAASGVSFGLQGPDHGTDAEECRSFEGSSHALQELVGKAADAFAKQLGRIVNQDAATQLLPKKFGGSYGTVEEMVRGGERLHHFHSYQLPIATIGAEEPTMDFHVDQGLFISFVPAMMVGEDSDVPNASTGSFVVRVQGRELDVHFDADSLVFVLGDAVNQLLNRGPALHVPSHAFRMPQDGLGLHRVWYGMMQLPPTDGLVPELGLTFGELRDNVINAATSDDIASEPALSLGCSRKLQARELSSQCNETQIYCWHRCYEFTEEVSPDACAAKNMGFNCTNQFDQIYIGGHGDFQPKCTDSTEMATPRPSVPQPEGPCAEWEDLLADSSFAHKAAFYENETYFLWNVKNSKLQGKMIHKGIVSWMAMGIENVGGKHKGMNGARIVKGRAVPGKAPTVNEYQIHPDYSAFRHWKTPLTPSALTNTGMTVSSCTSSITFETATLYGEALNLTEGTNRFIWALTQRDYPTDDFGGYSGYHSNPTGDRAERPRFRGHSELDLVGGSGGVDENTNTDDLTKDVDESKDELTNGSPLATSAALTSLVAIVAVALAS